MEKWKLKVRKWISENGKMKMEIKNKKMDIGKWKLKIRKCKMEIKNQKIENGI